MSGAATVGAKAARGKEAPRQATASATSVWASLAGAGGELKPRSDPIATERAVTAALAKAPGDLEVRLAAYRFYFYSHRLADALPHADVIIALAARRLNVGPDWSAVQPGDAAFDQPEEAPGLYLQAVLAWGYCAVRIGRREDGRRAIAKVAELDARDRFGARRLLAVVDAGEDAEDQ